MKELLNKLLEAEILSEESKAELETAYNEQLNEAVESARKDAEEQVRVELTEQWVEQRAALVEAVDQKVNAYLAEEIEELKGDIERFRDLEAEYAEKLVEAKDELRVRYEADTEELVEKLDTFLEIRLNEELNELKADIEETKKLQFGSRIFEGFVKEYKDSFVDEENVEFELRETRKQLDETLRLLEQSEKEVDQMTRKSKIKELTKSLGGKQRELMETILGNVPTKDLESGYSAFLGRVLKEEENSKEEENKVLSESAPSDNPEKEIVEEAAIITGDTPETEKEIVDADQVTAKQLNEDIRKKLRLLSGIEK